MKNHDVLFLKVYKYLCVAIFFLIALGGAVRAANAGLACPDWPLCFGDIIPDYHPQVYFEFIHRALAGTIGITSIVLNAIILKNSTQPKRLRYLAGFSILLLLSQVVMGGLTVLLKLHDKVVALHLALGIAFFATSLWIYLTVKSQGLKEKPILDTQTRGVSLILVLGIYGQILLGALVASNYAANVCTEFPLCHGKFIPTLSGTIGLHVIHRLGAYILTAIILFSFFFIRKNVSNTEIRRLSNRVLLVLLIQIALGISNVLFYTPPLITVLHLATGTYLLSIAIRIFRMATFRPAIESKV